MDLVIEKFLPLLMLKSHCEKALIRDEAKAALNLFVQNLHSVNVSYTATCLLC
jgi:hypothetical protein